MGGGGSQWQLGSSFLREYSGVTFKDTSGAFHVCICCCDCIHTPGDISFLQECVCETDSCHQQGVLRGRGEASKERAMVCRGFNFTQRGCCHSISATDTLTVLSVVAVWGRLPRLQGNVCTQRLALKVGSSRCRVWADGSPCWRGLFWCVKLSYISVVVVILLCVVSAGALNGYCHIMQTHWGTKNVITGKLPTAESLCFLWVYRFGILYSVFLSSVLRRLLYSQICVSVVVAVSVHLSACYI